MASKQYMLSKDSGISLPTDNSSIGYHVKADRKAVRGVMLVVFMLMLSVFIILFVLHIRQESLHGMKHIRTDVNTTPPSLKKQNHSLDFEKQKLQEKITKLQNIIGKVPYHVLELQKETIQNWTNILRNKFVVTRAADSVFQQIKAENVVAVIGPTGTGKSAYAYYAAFKLKETHEYVIVPARQPSDITQYYLPDKKQIFIIDDFIGKYSFDKAELALWEKEGPLLHKVLSNTDQTKVILTCRKSVWHHEKCERFGFSAFLCDLDTEEFRLNLSEAHNIVQSYIDNDNIKKLNDKIIMMYRFLPSLCSIFSMKTVGDVESFFTMPVHFIEKEIDNYKMKSPELYMSLAVLAIEQKLNKTLFFDNVEHEVLITNLFRESGFQSQPSKKLIINHLEASTDTYVKFDNGCFEFIHATMQNIVLYCIAKTFINSVLKYCKHDVFKNQVRLACIREDIPEEQTAPVIQVVSEHEDAYFTRLAKELCEGQCINVFENVQNVYPIFRKKWLVHLNKIKMKISLKPNPNGSTVLHVVSSLGYADYVSHFIKVDTRMVDQADANGNTPLHLASLNGHLDTMKNLVENSQNVHILNNDKVSPFFYACVNNEIQLVKYLTNLKGDLVKINETYTTKEHRSVLHIACLNGFNQIVQVLVNHHANVNIQDKNGLTPLHYTCLNGQVTSALLIVALANVNVKENTGETPLHMACRVGNENIVQLLINHNASVNSTTNDDVTPLHEACNNGHQNIANILLNKKANYRQENKNGWTALLFSCAKGYNDIVKMLLNLNIDVNISIQDGITPLMLACRGNHTNVVESLLISNTDVNQCNNFMSSPLELTCYKGNIDIVNLLLEHGASINLANKNGITPLHVACMNKHVHVVNVLIEKKADINSKDLFGGTPLYKACFSGDIEIVKILLNKGAKINITDNSGKSPLAIAKESGFSSIVELLDNANTVLL